MRGEVWRLEWRVALARRRRLAWSAGVPILLLLPVAASGAAAPHRATVYALFAVFFGLFGAAAPVVRDGRRGWVERLLLTGYGARPWLAERTVAHAAQDLLELGPALAGLLLLEGAAPAAAAAAGGGVLLGLLVANLLGTLAGAAVRSLGEAALVCAALGLVALHLAGAFRPPEPGTWQEAAAATSPFLPVVEAMRSVAGAGWGGAGAAGGVGDPAAWRWPLVTSVLLLAGAWVGAPWVAGRVTGESTKL